MKKAVFVKDVSRRFYGMYEVYKLTKPLKNQEGNKQYKHVVVSAVSDLTSGPETCILGADKNGVIKDDEVLDGSYSGGLDIRQALENAGYKVVKKETVKQ